MSNVIELLPRRRIMFGMIKASPSWRRFMWKGFERWRMA